MTGETEVEPMAGPRDVSLLRGEVRKRWTEGSEMDRRPWLRRIALTGFAVLLYYGYASAWWMPRMISG
jgi:hypothetical protein